MPTKLELGEAWKARREGLLLRACLVAAVVVFAIGCSNPRNEPLPDDLSQATSNAKFQAVVQKLPPDERDLLARYIETMVATDALAKKGIVPPSKARAKTIHEAVDTQRRWDAEGKADEEASKKLAKAYESLPKAEQAFCRAVNEGQEDYAEAKKAKENQLKLSALRTDRKEAIKDALAPFASEGVTSWVGTIAKLKTNSDGNASVYVTLPCERPVQVRTFGGDNLIPQSSPMFATLAQLGEGKKIVFAGHFYPDEKDFFRELSVSEAGSMTAPEFLFQFASIVPAP